jgi:SAM-dependent methyltransferase
MNIACFMFGFKNITREEIEGKRVLEVGSRNVNGSLRVLIEEYKPREYVGVDIIEGPGVDVLCDASGLISKFGAETFDAVICTEMIEHVRDWKQVIHNLKMVCKKKGIIVITTRSPGFLYHGWPYDFWRYDLEDLKIIFRDFTLERLESDPQQGVLLKCVKPQDFCEIDPGDHALYSIVVHRKVFQISEQDLRSGPFKRKIFIQRVKEFIIKQIQSIFP